VIKALENSGKLLIYASFASSEEQLKPVSVAAQKMAKLLKLNFEVVILGEMITPIYVYYKHRDEEPIPVYCNKREKTDVHEIYATLKNMMFVLSFHPRYSTLRHMRKEVMQLLS
jgi:hypothetical protein